MFVEVQIREQAIRDGWCEVEPTIFILSHRISARCNFASFEPPPDPHPAPQHCRTAQSLPSRLAVPSSL